MVIHLEDRKSYLELSRYIVAIEHPSQHIWWLEYCSISTSTLYDLTQYLILHSKFCIAILRNQTTCWLVQTWKKVCWNNNPTKWPNDINWTSYQFHQLNLPSQQGWQIRENTIHQWHTMARGAPCFWEWFRPGKWVTVNCNIIWLNLWYQTKVVVDMFVSCESKWSVKSNLMKEEEKEVYNQKGEVPNGECRVAEGSTDGDGGVQNEIEGCESTVRSIIRDWGVPIKGSCPFILSSTERGVQSVWWNRSLLIKV